MMSRWCVLAMIWQRLQLATHFLQRPRSNLQFSYIRYTLILILQETRHKTIFILIPRSNHKISPCSFRRNISSSQTQPHRYLVLLYLWKKWLSHIPWAFILSWVASGWLTLHLTTFRACFFLGNKNAWQLGAGYNGWRVLYRCCYVPSTGIYFEVDKYQALLSSTRSLFDRESDISKPELCSG